MLDVAGDIFRTMKLTT